MNSGNSERKRPITITVDVAEFMQFKRLCRAQRRTVSGEIQHLIKLALESEVVNVKQY